MDIDTLEKRLPWFVGAVCAVSIAGALYFAIHAEVAKAEAEGYTAGRQVEIERATAQMKSRAIVFEAEKRALIKERDDIKTQKQALRVITKYVPAVAGQIVEVKRDELPAAARAALPDAPGYSCMTEAAAVALGKNADELELCGKERTKLAADSVDWKTKYDAAVAQRDRWQTVAKGGGKWQRMKSAAKWAGIGAAVGYAAARAH